MLIHCAGARSPFRLSLGQSRRVAGVVCSQICRSGGLWCSGLGRCCGGGVLLFEMLSPISFYVAARWALHSLLRVWGSCGCATAVFVGRYCCMCRSSWRSDLWKTLQETAFSSGCWSPGPKYEDFPSAMEIRRRTCGAAMAAARPRLILVDAAVLWLLRDFVVIFYLCEVLLVSDWV